MLNLTITHRSQKFPLILNSSTSLSILCEKIYELTSVPTTNQKLLPKPAKGVSLSNSAGATTTSLEESGVRDGMTIMVIGATTVEVEKVAEAEKEASRWKQPRNYHPSLLQGNTPRSTAKPSPSSPFLSLAPHDSLSQASPLFSKIVAYLSRLANDPGIVHVCALHGYKVGHLTELLPWENPELLGLNENKGQTIRLRIRTDDAEGFRDYKTTRMVLVHELAHIDVSDHPPEFKILNSKLNAELAAYEKNADEGRHALVDGEMYVPPDEASNSSNNSALGGAYVLGGSKPGIRADQGSTQERREAILQATLRRIEKIETEIEVGCGSGGGQAKQQ